MNIGEVIEKWKSDFTWTGDVPNPFVRKDVSILPNPVNPTEVCLILSVSEDTTYVNGMPVPYRNSFPFHTYGQGGTQEEREGDAKRLEEELNRFMEVSKEERRAEIEKYAQQGAKIESANYFEW